MFAHQRRRSLAPGLLAAFLAANLLAGSAYASGLELRFLDVGQGDAVLIRNDGKTVLVDTGPSDRIVAKLHALGVWSIDLLIISHNHSDHLGGADALLAEIPVTMYLDNGYPTKTKIQRVILDLVDARGVTYVEPTSQTITLGDARLRIIPPAEDIGGDEQNNTSVGVIVEMGNFKALMTGDSEVEEINFWLAAGQVPDVDLLKAAHHGSRNGVTPLWLHRTKPEVVVISLGADNKYGHPHPMALRYYMTGDRRVFRTDQHGDVVVKVKANGTYHVETQRPGAPFQKQHAAEEILVPATNSKQHCCKTCRKGKACGDGCISKERLCEKPLGCACNG